MKYLQKLLGVFLVLIALNCVSVSYAASVIDSGTCGDNLTWTLTDDDTLTISGTGDMYDYGWFGNVYRSKPWYDYLGQIKTIIINNGVTRIGDYAFEFCTELTSVEISGSVTEIGNCALQYCRALTSVTIPDSVTRIGVEAFVSCNALKEMEIPKSVTEIGGDAFQFCYGLEKFVVDSANPNFCSEDGVLFDKNKTALLRYPVGNQRTSYTVPGSVTIICTHAFWGAYYLAGIDLPNGLTTIGDRVFLYCDSLESIEIPASVTSIGERQFECCHSLKTITVDSANPNFCSVNGVMFNKNKTVLMYYPVGNEQASYEVPVGVTSIGGFAFAGAWKLTAITLPDGLKSIDDWVFRFSHNITSIVLPESLTNVGFNAFEKCNGLTTVYYGGTEDQWKVITIADGNEALRNAKIIFEDTDSLDVPTVKVTNVSSSGKIKLSWNKVDGAQKYEVYRATSKSGKYTLIKTTTGTSLTNTSTTAGKTYYYKVRAIAGDNKGEFSKIVSRTCDLAQPKVKATNVSSSGKIKLTWDKIDGAVKYEVYRATSKSGTYKLIKTTTSTSFTNTSATAGKTYYYKVKAIASSSSANSAYSEVVSRTCDLARPEITVKLSSKGNPSLSWDKVDGAVKYEVYRATSKSGTYKLIKTTTSTSFTNTSVTEGKTYYYKVKAIASKSSANSAYSEVCSIKAK